ncbi:hypothetical protein MCHLDSM_05078 [Mycolicibacterium chlorophenolicum]|uniref:Uncharacterized protein n=1 Tax=Mycolicibacterium chlorophenolicum TaxID=37916 RepID=A0A0J6VGR2_9MYCO|nr:hypothetical protein MCHLDSM_05078 [Mycolicibacterium chlorophenolicum]
MPDGPLAHYTAIYPVGSKFLLEVWSVCDLPLIRPPELLPG